MTLLHFLGHEVNEGESLYFRDGDLYLEFKEGFQKQPYVLQRCYDGRRPEEPIVRSFAHLWEDRLHGIQAEHFTSYLERGILNDHPEIGRALANFQFLDRPFDFVDGYRWGRCHVRFVDAGVTLLWAGEEIFSCTSETFQEALQEAEAFCIEVWENRDFAEELKAFFEPPSGNEGPPWFDRLGSV